MNSTHPRLFTCLFVCLSVFVGCSDDGATPSEATGSGGNASGGAPTGSGSGGQPAGTGGSGLSTGGTGLGTGGDDSAGGSGGGSGGAVTSSGGDTNTGGSDASTGGESMGTGGDSEPDVLPSSGCENNPTMSSGSHTIQVDGQNRSFMMRIPENYDSSHPYRLVFAFHWNGGSMNDVDGGGSSGYTWSYYGLREQADNSTIFVAPQGLNNGWANSGGRDLAFVDAMIDKIEGDLCVDKSRVFSMGFSYGGGMTYGLACDRSDVFRAVAVYGGAVLSGCNDGSDPVAYLGIHGISDGTCNIAGGRSMRDRFVNNNGCTTQAPPEPNGGSRSHTCTSYQGCSDNPVRWCAFDGGHTPGHVDGGGDDGALTWTKTEAWKFFSQF